MTRLFCRRVLEIWEVRFPDFHPVQEFHWFRMKRILPATGVWWADRSNTGYCAQPSPAADGLCCLRVEKGREMLCWDTACHSLHVCVHLCPATHTLPKALQGCTTGRAEDTTVEATEKKTGRGEGNGRGVKIRIRLDPKDPVLEPVFLKSESHWCRGNG